MVVPASRPFPGQLHSRSVSLSPVKRSRNDVFKASAGASSRPVLERHCLARLTWVTDVCVGAIGLTSTSSIFGPALSSCITQYDFRTPCPSSSNACCVLVYCLLAFLFPPHSSNRPRRVSDVGLGVSVFPIRFLAPLSLRGSSSLGLVPSTPWHGISHSAEILYGSAVSHYSPAARLDPLDAERAPGGRWCVAQPAHLLQSDIIIAESMSCGFCLIEASTPRRPPWTSSRYNSRPLSGTRYPDRILFPPPSPRPPVPSAVLLRLPAPTLSGFECGLGAPPLLTGFSTGIHPTSIPR